jgi:hypothetical protein
MNVQDYMWQNFKQKAIGNYDWELPSLHLPGYCDYGFRLIGNFLVWTCLDIVTMVLGWLETS